MGSLLLVPWLLMQLAGPPPRESYESIAQGPAALDSFAAAPNLQSVAPPSSPQLFLSGFVTPALSPRADGTSVQPIAPPTARAFPPIEQATLSTNSWPVTQPTSTYPQGRTPSNTNDVIVAMPAVANGQMNVLQTSAVPLEMPPTYDQDGAADQVTNDSIMVGSAVEHVSGPVHHGSTGNHRSIRFLNRLRPKFGTDQGIGFERVMFAPISLDTATTSSNIGVRFTSARGLGTPDRLEYVWAAPGRGPQAESRLDVFNTQFRAELGNDLFGAITEINMPALNPVVNDNTVGFGDMAIAAKASLVSSGCTRVATIFRTYLNTGPADKGLGTGHVSLEPGLLIRHERNASTFYHGEVKYWLPLGGTPSVAGDVLKTGAGVSTIWLDADRFAVLPTLELQTFTFLAGGKTDPSGVRRHVNGDTAVDLVPGTRFVLGSGGGLGLWEMGVAGAMPLADRDWFDSRLMIDLRLVR